MGGECGGGPGAIAQATTHIGSAQTTMHTNGGFSTSSEQVDVRFAWTAHCPDTDSISVAQKSIVGCDP
jgi:hypothetical protein